MKIPTLEQQEWFWRKCGLHLEEYSDGCYRWTDQEGSLVSPVSGDTDLPIIDLNNLFGWAVPRVCCWEVNDNMLTIKGQGAPLKPEDKEDKAWWEVTIDGCEGKKVTTEDENLVLALFWAIYKLIKEQK